MEILYYPSKPAEERVKTVQERSLDYAAADHEKVSAMVNDVRTRGDAAVVEYTRKFDAPEMTADLIRATEAEIDAAAEKVEPEFLSALKRAASQIEAFHRRQVRNSWISTDRNGVLLGQLSNPVDAAGIYVPGAKGGTTPLVSSVLMGAVPAAIAGVQRVVMVTPPMNDCSVNPHLLAAAREAGVNEIYKIGGAWAIAALAYGTETVAPVDVIAGPGNIYVTLAKKIVSGRVGIDMIAGPSEILVIADDTADPACIASDLLSQAEHDPLASAVMITSSDRVAGKVSREIDFQLDRLDRKDIAKRSLSDYGAIFTVDDLKTAMSLANRIAPEHLELQVQNPFDWLSYVRNAGAVFLGRYSPEPMGDYVAGPNHVLPTGGSARFSSALSVDCFVKQTSVIYYTKDAFLREAGDVIRLAETEGLSAHAGAVKNRILKS